MEPAQTPPRLLFRKNGRPQACEPCRKRKVACDHAQPVCNRCRKSKRPSEACVYILGDSPAPRDTPRTTRPRRSRRGSRAPSLPLTAPTFPPPPATATRLVPESTSTETTATTSVTTTASRPRASVSASLPTSPDSVGTVTTPAVLGIGYLGFTSFCGIYEETRSSLNRLQPSGATPIGEIGATANCGLECSPPLTNQALETCLTILRHVPDRDVGLKLFESHVNPSDGWIRLAAKRMMASLYETFPQCFCAAGKADDAQLTALARTICQNTAKCVSDEESDPDKWTAQFTGTNLRWESLGVMFVYWELAARYLGPYRPDAGSQFQCVDEGTRVVLQYRYCVGASIELAKAAGSGGNTLLLFMSAKRTIIESIFSGDAS
ncbi:hypothetical protein CTA2_2370, partial [Colletotrichum tanaceti]